MATNTEIKNLPLINGIRDLAKAAEKFKVAAEAVSEEIDSDCLDFTSARIIRLGKEMLDQLESNDECLVDQHSVGESGDCFAGTLYYKLYPSKSQWLALDFYMY